MAWRFAIQSLWKPARAGLTRLNRLLTENGNSDDMIFQTWAVKDEDRPSDPQRRAFRAKTTHSVP